MYRADLRSASPSRFGTAVHHPEGRYGVGWEKRSTGEYAVIWALPLTVGDWSVELLTQGGIRRFSGGDDGWYPETQGNSGGPVGIGRGPAAEHLRSVGLGSHGPGFRGGILPAWRPFRRIGDVCPWTLAIPRQGRLGLGFLSKRRWEKGFQFPGYRRRCSLPPGVMGCRRRWATVRPIHRRLVPPWKPTNRLSSSVGVPMGGK